MTRNLKEFVNHDPELRSSLDEYGPKHVVVLLAHYNGGRHLSEQLESLAAQTHRDWSLIVSDDGSSDDWLKTTGDFARSADGHRVWLVSGPGRGFAQNFLTLVAMAGPSVPFAAFCDQDDVWLPGKLARALEALNEVPPDTPAVYCGRTIICSASLAPVGVSPLFTAPPGFRNALVQNIAGGNTMVLNRAALDLLQDTLRHAQEIVSHDWWTYQLVTGAGGQVIYDPEPCLLYRQHGANRIGANTGVAARLHRARQLWKGQFRDWNDAQTRALQRAKHWLTPEARELLERFSMARRGAFLRRLSGLGQSGIYRQTWKGQIALWISAVLNRL